MSDITPINTGNVILKVLVPVVRLFVVVSVISRTLCRVAGISATSLASLASLASLGTVWNCLELFGTVWDCLRLLAIAWDWGNSILSNGQQVATVVDDVER